MCCVELLGELLLEPTWASLEHFGLLGNYFLGFYEGLRDNNALVGVVGLFGIIRPTARRSGDCQPR
jgi:hypothetical protein